MELEPPLFRLLVTALARRQFLSPDGGELPCWAEKALESLDSPSLRILAGLTAPWNQFEIDQYLKRCSEELGWSIPSDDELPRLYAGFIAEDMLSGSLALIAGCGQLRELLTKAQRPAYLERWIMIGSLVEAVREGHLSLASVEEELRAEALKLLPS